MLSLAVFLSAFILFFILSPGVLLRLPPKGDKVTTAVVHAIVFSILFSLLLYFISSIKIREGSSGPNCHKKVPGNKVRGNQGRCDDYNKEKGYTQGDGEWTQCRNKGNGTYQCQSEQDFGMNDQVGAGR